MIREAVKEQRLGARPRALSDVEPHVVCAECGRRSADVRPDWNCYTALLAQRKAPATADAATANTV